MNILSIDCSDGLKVALQCNNKLLEKIDYSLVKQTNSLLFCVDELLKKQKILIKDIDYIAVCVGPGSFTGIRVAISTAKGLAIGTNAKVVTFDSFEPIMANITERNFGVIVNGFADKYYYYFKKYGRIFEGCNTLQNLQTLYGDVNLYADNPSVVQKLSSYNISSVKYDAIKVVNEKIEKGAIIATNQIEPLYLRASQAEIERNKHENN